MSRPSMAIFQVRLQTFWLCRVMNDRGLGEVSLLPCMCLGRIPHGETRGNMMKHLWDDAGAIAYAEKAGPQAQCILGILLVGFFLVWQWQLPLRLQHVLISLVDMFASP